MANEEDDVQDQAAEGCTVWSTKMLVGFRRDGLDGVEFVDRVGTADAIDPVDSARRANLTRDLFLVAVTLHQRAPVLGIVRGTQEGSKAQIGTVLGTGGRLGGG